MTTDPTPELIRVSRCFLTVAGGGAVFGWKVEIQKGDWTVVGTGKTEDEARKNAIARLESDLNPGEAKTPSS
jgi:hypothetical protein